MFNKNEWIQWAQQSQNNNSEMKDFRHDYWRKNDATRSYLNQNNTVKENSQNEPVELQEGIGAYLKGTHKPFVRNDDGKILHHPDVYDKIHPVTGKKDPRAGKPHPNAGEARTYGAKDIWRGRGVEAKSQAANYGVQKLVFDPPWRKEPKEKKQDVGQTTREFETESVELGQSMKLKFDKLKKVKDVHEIVCGGLCIAGAAATVASLGAAAAPMIKGAAKKPPVAQMRPNKIQRKPTAAPMHASYNPEGEELNEFSILKERVRILKERVHNLQEQDLQELWPLLGLLGRGAAMAGGAAAKVAGGVGRAAAGAARAGAGAARAGISKVPLGMSKVGTKVAGAARTGAGAVKTGVSKVGSGMRGALTKKAPIKIPTTKVPIKPVVKAPIKPVSTKPVSTKPVSTKPVSTKPNTAAKSAGDVKVSKNPTGAKVKHDTTKPAGKAGKDGYWKDAKVEKKKSWKEKLGDGAIANAPLAAMMMMGGGGGKETPTANMVHPTGTARNA